MQLFRELPPFRPIRFFRNGHMQTILGAYCPARTPRYTAVRHETKLNDGDRVLLHDDLPASWNPGDPVVLLVHGLSGSHASPYVGRTAAKLNARGIRTFRMDLRGCGAGRNLAVRPLHAGRSEDAAAALATIASLCPGSPIDAVAFSMGANILLKMAGEMDANAPEYVRTIIAVAPPVDLAITCQNLSIGWNAMYDRSFVRALLRHIENRHDELPNAEPIRLSRRPRRVYEFDDWVTAPLSGFAGADDYYTQASSAPYLPNIHVPTLILAAADDPLVPVRMFEQCSLSPSVELHVTEYGGHVGYVGIAGCDPDRRWLEWRIVEQVTGLGSYQRTPLRRRPWSVTDDTSLPLRNNP